MTRMGSNLAQLSSLPVGLRWTGFKDWVAMEIAYRLPVKVVYWAVVRAGANAIQGDYSSQEAEALTIVKTMARWP